MTGKRDKNIMLLSGIVGSKAYGLDTPLSDTDRLGIFAAETVRFHGLHPPVDKAATIVEKNPDVTLHEVGKFAKLALGGNPTVMELMWLPEYEVITPLGRDLIAIRKSFLSAKKVRDAYLGYATQQVKLLERHKDGTGDTKKHARHLLRLCYQGLTLYTTGVLEIKLAQPEAFRSFGERVALDDNGIEYARDRISTYEALFNGRDTVLPDEPDEATVEAWLLRVRAVHL